MAGRPAAPRFIVPEGDILDDNPILNENYNIILLACELHRVRDTQLLPCCCPGPYQSYSEIIN